MKMKKRTKKNDPLVDLTCEKIKELIYGGKLHIPLEKTEEETISAIKNADISNCTPRIQQWINEIMNKVMNNG